MKSETEVYERLKLVNKAILINMQLKISTSSNLIAFKTCLEWVLEDDEE